MLEFDAPKMGLLLVGIEDRIMLYQRFSETEAAWINPTFNGIVRKILKDVVKFAKRSNFYQTQEAAILALGHLETLGDQNVSTLESEMRHIRHAIVRDARKTIFLRLEPQLSRFFDQPALFGMTVDSKYPSARADIREAGTAIACELGTAAIFHLMRAVEWALRALCSHLGIRKAKSFKKSGKVKYTPISYVDWETMLNELQLKIDTRISKLKRGKAKQEEQEFYYPLIQDIKGFRDAWRNHVMHTRREYSVNDALAVFGHVQRFMEQVATRLPE